MLGTDSDSDVPPAAQIRHNTCTTGTTNTSSPAITVPKQEQEIKNKIRIDDSSVCCQRIEQRNKPLSLRGSLSADYCYIQWDPCSIDNDEDNIARELSDWTGRRNQKKNIIRMRMIAMQSSDMIQKDNMSQSSSIRQFQKCDRRFKWLKSLQALDPRVQIMSYFEEVARQGGPLADPLAPPPEIDLLSFICKSCCIYSVAANKSRSHCQNDER